MLQDGSGPILDVSPVAVNGHPGELGLGAVRTANWPAHSDGSGHRILVHAPVTPAEGRTVRLTEDQILTCAGGVTVASAVQVGKG